MIEREIRVAYFINNVTKKIGFDLDEIAAPGQHGWEVDCQEKERLFTRFTNKGKVSKPQRSQLQIVNERAEELLEKELLLERDREKDELVAKELVLEIDRAYLSADENTQWETVKVTYSHIPDGFGGCVQWWRQVPVEVAHMARRVSDIRRRHHLDPNFDFEGTAYLYQEAEMTSADKED